MEARGTAPWRRATSRSDRGSCSLLIVDRSIDWMPLLVHDMHYEALLHDLLEGQGADLSEGRFSFTDRTATRADRATTAAATTAATIPTTAATTRATRATRATTDRTDRADGSTKHAVLGEEKDALWDQYRHMAMYAVNDLVVNEVRVWSQKDEEMRARGDGRRASTAQMVSSTLSALHALPEHKERFRKLQVHSQICELCFQVIKSQKLVDLAAFEQDLATGVTSTGSRLDRRAVDKELLQYLQDPELSQSLKLRLLLLYEATEAAAGSYPVESLSGDGCLVGAAGQHQQLLHRQQQLLDLASAQLGPKVARQLRMLCWPQAQQPVPRESAERRRQYFRDRARQLATGGPSAHGSCDAGNSGGAVGSSSHSSAAGGAASSGGGSGQSYGAPVSGGLGSPRAARLRRWEPRLLGLLGELSAGALDPAEFPSLRRAPAAASAAPSVGRGGVASVAIFVVGGITLPEIRA
ncbi:unnamed protein product, partial [Polarella glacialis]